MKYAMITAAGAAGIVLLGFLCRAVFVRLVDRRVSAYHNDLMEKHYEEVENMYRQMRGWRMWTGKGWRRCWLWRDSMRILPSAVSHWKAT